MNRIALALARPAVRLRRFSHRKGFGVHSPFAFEYITRVVLERTPYHLYRDLEYQEAGLVCSMGYAWAHREPRRVKRLLLRVANRAKVDSIVDIVATSSAALYLQGGRSSASYIHLSGNDWSEQLQIEVQASERAGVQASEQTTAQVSKQVGRQASTDAHEEVGVKSNEQASRQVEAGNSRCPAQLVYLHDYQRPDLMRQAWEVVIRTADSHDVIVVEGIGYTRPMRDLWQIICNHQRTGITFDLHDVGIALLDRSISKRNYIVSF